MKKLLALALCALLAVTAFAACGKAAPAPASETPAADGSESPASEMPVSETPAEATAPAGTIKVGNWDTSTMTYIQPLIDAFQVANPDIKVEIVDTPSADYTAKLSVQLNGGSDIDAFWIKDSDTTKGLANKGQLADLTEYITRDGVNPADFNGLAERFVIDGKTVALPATTAYYVLFYNKDIFDAAGVAYPSNDMTWVEYEALAKKLTSGEGEAKIYGGHLHTWNALVQNWGVQDGKNTIMATDYSFFKPAYEMALRMQNDGTIMDYATLTTGQIHYSSAFAKGNIATMPMGSWYISRVISDIQKGESKINWGIATIPHPEGVEAGWTVGSVTPFAINNASKNKDAAWAFAKFLVSPEGAAIYAQNFQIPSTANAETLQGIAASEGMPEGALEALQVKNISLDRPMEDKVADINAMLGEQHSLIMLGEANVDQGIAEMGKLSAEIQG